jgi:hypothetical protein
MTIQSLMETLDMATRGISFSVGRQEDLVMQLMNLDSFYAIARYPRREADTQAMHAAARPRHRVQRSHDCPHKRLHCRPQVLGTIDEE